MPATLGMMLRSAESIVYRKKRFNATETMCAFILDTFSSIPVMHADPFIAAAVSG